MPDRVAFLELLEEHGPARRRNVLKAIVDRHALRVLVEELIRRCDGVVRRRG